MERKVAKTNMPEEQLFCTLPDMGGAKHIFGGKQNCLHHLISLPHPGGQQHFLPPPPPVGGAKASFAPPCGGGKALFFLPPPSTKTFRRLWLYQPSVALETA